MSRFFQSIKFYPKNGRVEFLTKKWFLCIFCMHLLQCQSAGRTGGSGYLAWWHHLAYSQVIRCKPDRRGRAGQAPAIRFVSDSDPGRKWDCIAHLRQTYTRTTRPQCYGDGDNPTTYFESTLTLVGVTWPECARSTREAAAPAKLTSTDGRRVAIDRYFIHSFRVSCAHFFRILRSKSISRADHRLVVKTVSCCCCYVRVYTRGEYCPSCAEQIS